MDAPAAPTANPEARPVPVFVGTAGWSIPLACAAAFPGAGSRLERYARRLPAAEINSSFHRPHRRATYERWAAAAPASFRFSVKLPKAITHERRLVGAEDLLRTFVEQASGLGEKLAVVLAQLPPSLAFDADVADAFLARLSGMIDADLACEPRHPSWFGAEADALFARHRVARVAADPVLAPGGEQPGGWPGLRYHRLHGAPQIYRSPYGAAFLDRLARDLRTGDDVKRWCVFDNTASGAVTDNALALWSLLT